MTIDEHLKVVAGSIGPDSRGRGRHARSLQALAGTATWTRRDEEVVCQRAVPELRLSPKSSCGDASGDREQLHDDRCVGVQAAGRQFLVGMLDDPGTGPQESTVFLPRWLISVASTDCIRIRRSRSDAGVRVPLATWRAVDGVPSQALGSFTAIRTGRLATAGRHGHGACTEGGGFRDAARARASPG